MIMVLKVSEGIFRLPRSPAEQGRGGKATNVDVDVDLTILD